MNCKKIRGFRYWGIEAAPRETLFWGRDGYRQVSAVKVEDVNPTPNHAGSKEREIRYCGRYS